MAYMSQENKKRIVALAKPILKKYGIKATFSVNHHTSLECNIKSGKIDFIKQFNTFMNKSNRPESMKDYAKGYIQANHYHLNNYFEGEALACLQEIKEVMMSGNHDNSDAMVDYFDVGWYIHINIGKWNKPYQLEA
jgi:hypothetical protein